MSYWPFASIVWSFKYAFMYFGMCACACAFVSFVLSVSLCVSLYIYYDFLLFFCFFILERERKVVELGSWGGSRRGCEMGYLDQNILYESNQL